MVHILIIGIVATIATIGVSAVALVWMLENIRDTLRDT